MRERGLKFFLIIQARKKYYVAPRAGAWIEIEAADYLIRTEGSLPVRERGLKLEDGTEIMFDMDDAPQIGSASCRERG